MGDESPDESHAHLYTQFCSLNCQEVIAATATRKEDTEREREGRKGEGGAKRVGKKEEREEEEKEGQRKRGRRGREGKGREKRKEGGRKEEKKDTEDALHNWSYYRQQLITSQRSTTNRFHRAHPCLTYAVQTGRTIKAASVILEKKV